MHIAVIGTGYVGLVVGTCFSEMGNDVYCVDIDSKRVEDLKSGKIPIYEPGLDSLVIKNYKEGRIHFTTSIEEGIKKAQFVFIAVGTPPLEDGSADLKHVLTVAKEIGTYIDDYKIVINKSTVPVGTADKVKEQIEAELKKRGAAVDFDVVSNPEFLKEGNAVSDFMKPDRVIIGTESEKARKMMEELYSVFFRQRPKCIFMDVRSAEVTKYAANSMLATKISFINEMSNLCERVGADIESVRIGIGADKRIGYSFIYPGVGYGGSCFPKDVKAIIKTAKDYDYSMDILEAVEKVNDKQKEVLFDKVKAYFQLKDESLKGKTIGIWGLSFKPETDDMREAPALTVIKCLIESGARVQAHDPKAVEEAKLRLNYSEDVLCYCDEAYNALDGADAMMLLTEWHMYRQPDFDRIKSLLKTPVIFDGRNQYNPEYLKDKGFDFYSIGRK